MTAAQIESAAGPEAVAIMRRHKLTVGQAADWAIRFDGQPREELCAALDEAFVDFLTDAFRGDDVSDRFGG